MYKCVFAFFVAVLLVGVTGVASAAVPSKAYVDTIVANVKKFDTANMAVVTGETGEMTTGQIQNAMIADDAVTTNKILSQNVTEDKIATDAITETKIKDAAVTTNKIADGQVTRAKTDGIFGKIPSGGQGSTTADADIWVE